MSSLKKLAGGKANQSLHNNEDARVKAETVANQAPERKGVKWLKQAAKFVAKIGLQRFVIWILEDPDSAWDYLCSHGKLILEVLSS